MMGAREIFESAGGMDSVPFPRGRIFLSGGEPLYNSVPSTRPNKKQELHELVSPSRQPSRPPFSPAQPLFRRARVRSFRTGVRSREPFRRPLAPCAPGPSPSCACPADRPPSPPSWASSLGRPGPSTASWPAPATWPWAWPWAWARREISKLGSKLGSWDSWGSTTRNLTCCDCETVSHRRQPEW